MASKVLIMYYFLGWMVDTQVYFYYSLLNYTHMLYIFICLYNILNKINKFHHNLLKLILKC